MRTRLFYEGLLVIALTLILGAPSYCAGTITVSPSTTQNIGSVLPGNWKQADTITLYGGTYCNQVICNADGNPYSVQISLSDPTGIQPYLTSTSTYRTIPVSNLSYMLTYVNIWNDNTHVNIGEGTGSRPNYQKYVPFSFSSPAIIYSTNVAQEIASNIQGQCQLMYAVLVPNDQPAGVYSGKINYQVGSVTGSANISVTVGSEFTLSVDRGSADFETMKPGTVKDNIPVEGIIITSKTNTGNPWYLKISNDNPLSSGPYVIPNSNLIWYGWTDGVGTWYGTGNNSITFAPELMYASGANERNNMPDGTNNHLKFKLTVPSGQPGGKYLSNIKLTMTE